VKSSLHLLMPDSMQLHQWHFSGFIQLIAAIWLHLFS